MKNTQTITLLTFLLVSFLMSKAISAQEIPVSDSKLRRGYGIEIISATHGAGAAFSIRKNYYYSLRLLSVSYDNKIKMDEKNNDNSYEYAYHSEFQNHAIIANIHPTGNRFFISSGLYNINMKYQADGYARRSFTDNDKDYVLEADYKTLVHYKNNTPYVGIGMGAKRHQQGNIALRAEMGLLFMPAPDYVALDFGAIRAVGDASLTSDASVAAQTELRDKAEGAYLAKIKRDAEAFNAYPIFEVGITYNF